MLHKIKPQQKKKSRKRVGRGGKRGNYSGRGMKGQKSRAGSSIRPAERDFIIRLPKRRGFRNPPLNPKPKVVNVSQLEKVFEAGDKITAQELISCRMVRVRKGDKKFVGIKVLGNGVISKAFTIQGLSVSKAARDKIESAGGKIL